MSEEHVQRAPSTVVEVPTALGAGTDSWCVWQPRLQLSICALPSVYTI
jgi:hypothetical protein